MTDQTVDARITGVLPALEIPTSGWYCRPIPEAERRRPGPKPKPNWALIPDEGGDPLVPMEVYTSSRSIRIPKWQGWAKNTKEKLDRILAEPA